MPSTEPQSADYRQKYRNMKRELKVLIYENECFQEELKKAQRKLLKVSRDKSFLLDRLLNYETVESSTSDSEATASSDSDTDIKPEVLTLKKKRTISNLESQDVGIGNSMSSGVTAEVKRKKSRKVTTTKSGAQQNVQVNINPMPMNQSDGHMTSEEIERHLEAKQALRDLLPEKTPLTVPAEMFSNESSAMDWLASHLPTLRDSKHNGLHDVGASETSSNIAGGISEDDGLIIDLHE